MVAREYKPRIVFQCIDGDLAIVGSSPVSPTARFKNTILIGLILFVRFSPSDRESLIVLFWDWNQ